MNAKNVENVLNKLAVYKFTWEYIQMKTITVVMNVGNVFFVLDTLQKHMRTHTWEKSFSWSNVENLSPYYKVNHQIGQL